MIKLEETPQHDGFKKLMFLVTTNYNSNKISVIDTIPLNLRFNDFQQYKLRLRPSSKPQAFRTSIRNVKNGMTFHNRSYTQLIKTWQILSPSDPDEQAYHLVRNTVIGSWIYLHLSLYFTAIEVFANTLVIVLLRTEVMSQQTAFKRYLHSYNWVIAEWSDDDWIRLDFHPLSNFGTIYSTSLICSELQILNYNTLLIPTVLNFLIFFHFW